MAIFLDQNGVLSMGDKTPVTILQETLQKRGLTPLYELLYDGTGTLEPIFKYQVTAADLSAIGDGRTKKAAKHDAAAALLKRMQVNRALTESADIIGTEDVDIASPYTGAINQNFVGMLDEVCVINRLPNAVIVPIREEGPPHARVFTMQCQVSRVTETAVARTKKQAKHLASQQMIKRIEEILGDKYTPLAEKAVGDVDDADDLYGEQSNLMALECGNLKLDFAIPISNMHNTFFYRSDEFLLPKVFENLSLENEEFYEKMANPKVFMDNLLQELGGICKSYPVTKSALIEALEEVDNHYNLKSPCLNEEDNLIEEQNTDRTVDDEDKSNVAQFVLEEFHLEDSEVISLCSRDAPVLASGEKDTINSTINHCSITNDISNKRCCVFLSVQCLQGVWAFWGQGDDSDEAIDAAAIEAIKFFRVLSIPSENKSAEVVST